MHLDQIITQIKKHVPIVEEEWNQFVALLKVETLKKNDIWEKSGIISKKMGFINKGILQQYYLKDGNAYTDSFFAENEFIGNYISNLSGTPSETAIMALEPCELLVLSFEEMGKLAQQIPNVAKFAQIIGDKKLVELKTRSTSLLMDSAEERYYKLMEQRPDLFNRVPQYLIAQYLGIRPESLSRIRKKHLS